MFDEDFYIENRKSPKKTTYAKLVKKKGKLPPNAIIGRIFCAIGNFFYVKANSNLYNDLIECTLAGTIITKNESSTLACVGDWVYFLVNESDRTKNELRGKIVKIEERKSYLIRKAINTDDDDVIASNVDKLIILVSAKIPKYNTKFIDRLIISAEYGNIEPLICVNKIDLLKKQEFLKVQKDFEIYNALGLDVVYISALNSLGIDKLTEKLKDSDVVMCGQSGVGKSTLLNVLAKEEIMKVKEISQKTSKGKHTTSFTLMYDLKEFRLVDTPGIREFGLWNISKEELPFYFHEFDKYYLDCKYNPCTHTHEPECKVKEAVDSGKISFKRYESYLNIFYSLE